MKPADSHSKGNEKMQGSNEGVVNIVYPGRTILVHRTLWESAFT
jgi:hypothetical protein